MTEAASQERWSRRSTGLYVALAVFAVFAPTLVFRRIAYDDMWLWGDDSPLRSLSGDTLRTIFFELDARARHPFGSEYLPVRDLLVAVDMAVWGGGERGPHLTQLVLYAATVYGMGRLLIAWGLRADIAWVGTLVWAIHPLHVESVAWLSERKGILAGLFCVLCGHAWIRYRRGGPWTWLALAMLSAVAGVWSKAPAMFVPPVFAIWDLVLLPAARRRWFAILGVGLATALAAAPVLAVARDIGVIENEVELAEQSSVVRALGSQGHYVKGLVLLEQGSLSYDIQTDGAGASDLALGIALVVGSLALGWICRGRPWVVAMLAWMWLAFVPISHLFANVHILAADRYVYLWSLSACVGVAALVLRLSGTARLVVGGAVVCVLAVTTIRTEGAWASSTQLFARAHEISPGDPKACQNFAYTLYAAGEKARAFSVLERCVALRPDHPYILDSQARILATDGRLPEALRSSERAAASGRAGAMWYHATLLARAGRSAEALTFAERAARKNPTITQHVWTWAELLVENGRGDAAELLISSLLARDPSGATAMVAARVALGRRAWSTAEARLDLAASLGANTALVSELRARIPEN